VAIDYSRRRGRVGRERERERERESGERNGNVTSGIRVVHGSRKEGSAALRKARITDHGERVCGKSVARQSLAERSRSLMAGGNDLGSKRRADKTHHLSLSLSLSLSTRVPICLRLLGRASSTVYHCRVQRCALLGQPGSYREEYREGGAG